MPMFCDITCVPIIMDLSVRVLTHFDINRMWLCVNAPITESNSNTTHFNEILITT